MEKEIRLSNGMYPNNLKVARTYRGVSKWWICTRIASVELEDITDFESGAFAALNENQLREVMEFLEFPYEFLFKEVKDIKTSMDL